jgi:putative transcriptional regulator
MKKHAKSTPETFNWSQVDALTDEEIHAAALADSDAQPLTEAQLARMKPIPQVKLLRVRLHLTQDQFSKRYGIPLTTLRDWEQGRSQPDQAVRSYLKVIANDPDGVRRALKADRKTAA